MEVSQITTEGRIRTVLRAGVGTSMALMFCGVVLLQLTGDRMLQTQRLNEYLQSVMHVSRLELPAIARTIAYTGILFLILTPLLRVFTALASFVIDRNWKFTAVSFIVFAMLIGEIVYAVTK
jgi:uncharacterized membrane protein